MLFNNKAVTANYFEITSLTFITFTKEKAQF